MSFGPRAGALVVGMIIIGACGGGDRDRLASAETDGGAPFGSDASPVPELPPFSSTPDAGDDDECAKIDLVFVVDDSQSMVEEQQNLAQNFGVVTGKLDAFVTKKGAKLDYRVAVTSSGRTVSYVLKPEPLLPGMPPPPPIPVHEKGADGRFRKACTMTRPWLERSDPSLAEDFACAANVGTSGPSLEMPLEALRLGITERIADGQNGAFLRDDALLAVVVLTDEDDCSRIDDGFEIKSDDCTPPTPGYLPPGDYVSMLDGIKSGRARWAAAVIAGKTQCQSQFGDAEAAVRLEQFVSQAGANAVFSSICAGDLTSGLEDALRTFDAACRKFNVR